MIDYAWLLKALLLICIKCLVKSYRPDEIINLPGVNFTLNFRQYSGYLSGGPGKYMHYWFVESQNRPYTDPVILWLNGGPGCSSLEGLFAELGPIRVKEDEKTLHSNPYSWNKIANIIFLDSPVGVGFSFSSYGQYPSNDDIAAEENYQAIQSFFLKFPQFSGNDFYITGESYAGVFIPTLSLQIIQGLAEINFKGFAIGNGFYYSEKANTYLIFYAHYHGLMGDRLVSQMTAYCCGGIFNPYTCNFDFNLNEMCVDAVKKFAMILTTRNLNIYNIDAKCYKSDYKYSRYAVDKVTMLGISLNSQFFFDSLPCTRTFFRNYLNLPSVRAAIHIPAHVPDFEVCNKRLNWNYVTQYRNLSYQMLMVLNAGIRGLIYFGDMDLLVNFFGGVLFSRLLNLRETREYTSWNYKDQIGGFVQYYNNNFTYLTVRGAGHMVPQDKPGPALKMIHHFIMNKPY